MLNTNTIDCKGGIEFYEVKGNILEINFLVNQENILM